ncbi:MAG TPA: AraC family transcriptional regulator [Chitinophagaceae bacterium]|nr:AraC family transcriptional regulator [Chitinophagaceae bacterium]
MHIRNLTQKLDVAFVIKDKWHLPVHKHTHYELQYIIKGKGQHIINEISCPYEKGDLFVLAPQDTHFFIFQERSAICIIKFHERFFEDFLKDDDFGNALKRLSATHRTKKAGGKHKPIIRQLMELIIEQHRKEKRYNQLVIKNSLALALTLAAADDEIVFTPAKDKKIQPVLSYIDQHITDKKMLSNEKIAAAFYISRDYFNQYFKRATGSSYKKYVQEYALQIIAQQFVNGNKTLKQLATEFGYSDESHLSHAFKTHFHQSPSSFRLQKQRR